MAGEARKLFRASQRARCEPHEGTPMRVNPVTTVTPSGLVRCHQTCSHRRAAGVRWLQPCLVERTGRAAQDRLTRVVMHRKCDVQARAGIATLRCASGHQRKCEGANAERACAKSRLSPRVDDGDARSIEWADVSSCDSEPVGRRDSCDVAVSRGNGHSSDSGLRHQYRIGPGAG